MSLVRFEGVSKSYGRLKALDEVSLAVDSSSLTVLCGPPRAGKSVLLRLLVGLEAPDSGRVLIDERDVTHLPAAARHIGYVPQSFALFPHMSVRDNIAYPLVQRRVAQSEIDRRLVPVAEMLRIAPLLGKTPSQLSGGEKQRAAIARGVLQEAPVFALDDPLVGLDFKLRESLMDELRDMQTALGATFLYATSDPLEALTMAERLAVLDAGRLVETGEVLTLYHEPSQLRSAELIGFPRCNRLPGHVSQGRCRTPLGELTVELPDGEVAVLVRPEHVGLGDGADEAGLLRLRARIGLMEHLGAECVLHLQAAGAGLVAVPATDQVAGLAAGDEIALAIATRHLMLFDPVSGQRLAATRVAAYA